MNVCMFDDENQTFDSVAITLSNVNKITSQNDIVYEVKISIVKKVFSFFSVCTYTVQYDAANKIDIWV